MANLMDNFAEFHANGTAVASTYTSTMGQLSDAGITYRAHVFIGVTFTDNNGAAATPGAGTFTVTAETANNPGVFQPITNGTSVDATAAATTLSLAGNITRIKVAPSGITTATKYNIKLVANAG